MTAVVMTWKIWTDLSQN
uniref:Uncharacterized protein n=1 Tax=Arundo donax TaxID=35708 RepID=A0A0A9CDV0_ARUDO